MLLGNAAAPTRGKKKTREVKCALWRVVAVGLELQECVGTAAKGFQSGVREAVAGRRRLLRHMRAWRDVVLRGGPRRAAALAEVHTAGDVARSVFRSVQVVTGGSLSALVSGVVAGRLEEVVRGSLVDAPVQAWWVKVWLLRWKVRVCEERGRLRKLACVQRRMRWAMRRMLAAVPGDALLRPARPPLVGRCVAEVARLCRALCGGTVLIPWEAGGVSGRRRQADDGGWYAVSAERGLAQAWCAWAIAGGASAMERERGRHRSAEETSRAARLVDWQERRGRVPPRALQALANARRMLYQRVSVRRRTLYNAEVAGGVAPDTRGRWAVEGVLGWRGGAADRQALVRWSGFDPTTGEAWRDSWVPRSHLTPDLRQGGMIRRRRTAFQIAQDDQDERDRYQRVQRRRCTRLEGTQAGPGL